MPFERLLDFEVILVLREALALHSIPDLSWSLNHSILLGWLELRR